MEYLYILENIANGHRLSPTTIPSPSLPSKA